MWGRAVDVLGQIKNPQTPLHAIYRALGFLLLVNFLVFGVSFISLNSWLDQRTEEKADRLLLTRLDRLYMTLSDAESAQRGFIITGSEGYLKTYNDRRADTLIAIKEFNSTTNTHENAAKLDKISRLAEKKIGEMQTTLETRETNGLPAASTLVSMHLGANIMAEINTTTRDVKSQLNERLHAYDVSITVLGTSTIALLPVAMLASIGLAIFVYRLFRQQIITNRELANLSRSKDEFIALASHQLRTPATAVRQYVSMVVDGLAGPITAQQEAFLTKANLSNDRQLTIIDDILKITKLDLDAIALRPKPTDLNQLVHNAVNDFKAEVKNAGHTISFRGRSKPTIASIDESLMRGVIDNLISNAIKYSPEGSKISVRVKKLDDRYMIRVKDNGVGIAEKDLVHLFQKFSRIPNILSVTAGGTGLGLYWCKAITELNGGEISVDSEPAVGSSFMITFPIPTPSDDGDTTKSS